MFFILKTLAILCPLEDAKYSMKVWTAEKMDGKQEQFIEKIDVKRSLELL